MESMDRCAETSRIMGLLRNRHSGEDWAYFDELRTRTGWGNDIGYIDGYAAGLWSKNKGFTAYEVKTDRSDFKNDIAKFHEKQTVALRNSNQFYYVCQHKLIAIAEVPEVSGLMYADAGGVKVVKVAPIRELEGKSLDPNFVRALLRAAATKHEYNLFLKFCGKDISEGDLTKLAEECGKKLSDYAVKEAAAKMALKNKSEAEQILDAVCRSVGTRCDPPYYGLKDFSDRLQDTLKGRQDALRLVDNVKYSIGDLSRASDALVMAVKALKVLLTEDPKKIDVDRQA